MMQLLAYAEAAGSDSINLVKVLAGIGIVAVVAVLAAVVIGISRSRGHRTADGIMVTAVFWAIIAASILIYTAIEQYNWSEEYTIRIESGYYDPRDVSDKPGVHWGLCGMIALGYAGMLVWASRGGSRDGVLPNPPADDS
jgi:hypothetical protein